jgi:hypothetical protein
MNYQERTLYGTLVADLTVYLLYLRHPARNNSLGWIVGAVFALIIVQIVVQATIHGRSRDHLQDERDALISLRGYRAGYFAFATCIVMGLGLLWLHVAFDHLDASRMAIHFLSVMFGMLVVSDVVRVLAQIIDYRRAV